MLMGCLLGQGLRAQTLGTNIIVNGDAETPPTAGGVWVDFSTADFGDATGTDGGIWYLTNTCSYPNSTTPMRSHGGNQFFSAGVNVVPSTETRTLTQIIDVSAFAGQDIHYDFSGWAATNGFLVGPPATPNVVEVTINWVDGSATNVYTYDNVYTPATFNFTGWFNITGSQDVMAADGIQTIQITLTAQNANTSTSIQAYFDDLSLVPNLINLPVTLVDFHALQQPDHTVALQWETAQEQNSKYTEVQRSADGKTYSAIGQVAAAGNSSSPKDYAFTDQSPLSGRGFYRLKMVDIDGSFKYSKILQVTTGATGAAIKVYSNPFHDQLGVVIPAMTSEKLVLSLFDQTGKICLRQNYTTQKGNNFVNLYPGGMAAGVYLLHVQGAQTNQTIRVLKQ
jgi:hypothetical protein